MDRSILLGSVPVLQGRASLATTSLPIGHDRISAGYSGDQDHLGSTSVIIVTIRGHRSMSRAADSLASPRSERSITAKATVSDGVVGAAASTGPAVTPDGPLALGTAVLDQTKATLPTGPRTPVRRKRPIFAGLRDSSSSRSAPRKRTIKQLIAAGSQGIIRVIINDAMHHPRG
jgi:hypothetical protein